MSDNNTQQNQALATAKKNRWEMAGKEITFSTGVKGRLTPVSSSAIMEAQSGLDDPPVPLVKIDGKDGEFENPNDPEYLRQKQEVFSKRLQAGIDTMIILGVDVEVPPEDTWLPKLKFLEKRGRISLAGFDLTDAMDKEFLYKKYIAMSSDDWLLLNEISGIAPADLEAAKKLF